MQTPDGQVWTSSAFSRAFWQRYLQVFSEVTILARVTPVDVSESNWHPVTGSGVNLSPLPYYLGLAGLIRKLPALIKTLYRALDNHDAVIFRVPSQTAMLARLLHPRRPFALEVVGDPADVFAAGITRPLLDKLLGRFSAWQLRRMTKKAVAVSYVTRGYLQQRYPPHPDRPAIACSSIALSDEWFVSAPRHYEKRASSLLFVGSFAQLYKGQDVLLQALHLLKRQGHHYQLTMVGDGKHLKDMQTLANELELSDSVVFTGEQPHQKILSCMQRNDVFVLPSRTEGLPRVMIEAMATGMPAIGSDAGGIPELLPEECLAKAGSTALLAQRIHQLCSHEDMLNQCSARNLKVAGDYHQDKLNALRQSFYQSVYQQFRKETS